MTHPFDRLDPAQTVQVLPRYLAGPGIIDPRTVWPFPYDQGWPFAQTSHGAAVAFSPCLRLQTTYDPQPDTRGEGTWSVTAHRAPFTPPDWRITFDATTPVELIHDVHTELLDLYFDDVAAGDGDRLFEDDTPSHEVYAPLLARGWSHTVKTNGIQTFLTPDGLGGVRHCYAATPSSTSAWTAWGGLVSGPYWTADITFGTPVTLVAALTASLASTGPLQRTVQDIPTPTRRALYIAAPKAAQPQKSATPAAAPPPPGAGPGRTR